jgi:hypothetical protein
MGADGLRSMACIPSVPSLPSDPCPVFHLAIFIVISSPSPNTIFDSTYRPDTQLTSSTSLQPAKAPGITPNVFVFPPHLNTPDAYPPPTPSTGPATPTLLTQPQLTCDRPPRLVCRAPITCTLNTPSIARLARRACVVDSCLTRVALLGWWRRSSGVIGAEGGAWRMGFWRLSWARFGSISWSWYCSRFYRRRKRLFFFSLYELYVTADIYALKINNKLSVPNPPPKKKTLSIVNLSKSKNNVNVG